MSTTIPDPSRSPPPGSRERADALLAWLRTYARDRISSRLIDERRCIPPHVVLDFGSQGVLGLEAPERVGGLALGHRDAMRVVEQLGAIDLSLATFVVNHNFLGLGPIWRDACPDLRDELAPQLAQGRILGAFALTEPGAGSNPQALASAATPRGDGGWALRGTKVWSGSAAWAGVTNVFARVPGEAGEQRGITAFAVRAGTPGLRHGTEALTLGMRGMVQSAVHLDDVAVGPGDVLGEVGGGLSVAQDAMTYTRLAICATSVGGMKRCLQLMHRYAARRSIATGPLLDNPVTLSRLAASTAATDAVEALLAEIAERLDEGSAPPPMEAYIACKTTGPELLWDTVDALVQLLGGRGYLEPNLAPQILRDARVFRIFEGPTETLNMFLGLRAVHQGAALRRFLGDDLGAAGVRAALDDAIEQIGDRTASALGTGGPDAGRWLAFCAGEVAGLAILWAAADHAARRAPSERRSRSADWCRRRFERKLAGILAGDACPAAGFGAEAATAAISGYAETIGDLEQSLPGEDHRIDELLRRGDGGLGA